MTRLERFRSYVDAMNPASSDTRRKDRLYVPSDPRDAIVDTICSALELTPSRRLLVVGCTGSGKTTLIRRCINRIREAFADTGDLASYVDVSRLHRLDTETLHGVLVAVAGDRLIKRAPIDPKESEHVRKARTALNKHAHGYHEWVPDDEGGYDEPPDDYDDEPPGRYVVRHGALRKPAESLKPTVFAHLVQPLQVMTELAVGSSSHVVFAFDSLDRLADPGRFREAVRYDLPVLAAAGIGSLVVGPVRYSLGSDRSIRDLFDAVHVVPTVDIHSAEGTAFVEAVLKVRDGQRLLSDESRSSVCEGSGGVLRDLISLAQRSGEEAYSRGHDAITPEDVAMAVSALGDSLVFGVDDAALRVLRMLDEKGDFVIRGDAELALVDQRLVLNDGPGRWRIHPALLPKLRAIPTRTE